MPQEMLRPHATRDSAAFKERCAPPGAAARGCGLRSPPPTAYGGSARREELVELGYGRLLAMLCDLHPERRRATVVARLQYFQRQGFPPTLGAERGGPRADYGAEGLMKLALAFEVLVAGTPPGLVAELVEEGWEGARRLLAIGWKERDARTDALPVFVQVNGLGEKRREVGRLRAGDMVEFRSWGQGRGDMRSVLVVDVLRLAKALGAVVSGKEGRSGDASLRRLLDVWAGAV